MYKSGFINIIGLPNAGKSSIINRLLGENFSIVTSKAQTTRHRAFGIINGDNFQAIISDTPGFTLPKNKIHEYMNKKIIDSFKDADIILLVIELGLKNNRENKLVEKIKDSKVPVLLILNKVDKVNQSTLKEESEFWKTKNLDLNIYMKTIKKVGTESRKDLEIFFNKKVFLELNVKVIKDWRKNSNQLKKLGYN